MAFPKCCVILLIILFVLDMAKCSLVIDAESQRGVYVSEYCPKMEYCKEGTHVMCMYYDKDNKMGPHCLNSPNITITPVLASKLLEISNAIRSKLALGKEKGKGGEPLPRAFGMLRLQWDEELATFAQVWANQCVLGHDICRATKSFSNPGQTAGLVRLSYPEWFSLSSRISGPGANKPGLNEDKLMYAIKQSAKSWYLQKGSVSKDMVLKYPNWFQQPMRQQGKLYMEMITGHATHMGCGMSAYTEYTYRSNYAALNYNSIEIICNFSARPAPGTAMYHTTIPSDATPGSCGCPVGYEEDEDCLCNENPNYTPPKPKTRSCSGKNCVPSIVLLPIIAMEDASPQKIKKYMNETRKNLNNLEIFNNDKLGNSDHVNEAYSRDDFEETLREAHNNLQKASDLADNDPWYVQKKFNLQNSIISDNEHETSSHNKGINHVRTSPRHHLKTSIFSKSNTFELPVKGQTIKDVPPRKDFTKVQNLVNVYLTKKRSFSPAKLDNDAFKYHVTIAPVSNDVSSRIQRLEYKNISNAETDKKVLYLLDSLEREVKHTDLDESEKKILDDKLRKIYGHISNEPKNTLSSETNKVSEGELNRFQRYEDNVKGHVNKEIDTENRKYLHQLYIENSNERPKKDSLAFNIKKRLLVSDDTDTVKKRFEKPLSNIDYELAFDANYNAVQKTRHVNALVEYNPRLNKLRNFANEPPVDESSKRQLINNDFKHTRYDDVRPNNYHLNGLNDAGDLNYERRKYYQDKIDYLEQKLQKSRVNRRQKKVEPSPQIRRVQPNRNELPLRPERKESEKSEFYVPDRARSVHGF